MKHITRLFKMLFSEEVFKITISYDDHVLSSVVWVAGMKKPKRAPCHPDNCCMDVY
jgi:hypothetical protein